MSEPMTEIQTGFHILVKINQSNAVIWANFGPGDYKIGIFHLIKKGNDHTWKQLGDHIYDAASHPETMGNLLLAEHLCDLVAGVSQPSKFAKAQNLIAEEVAQYG